ncbi:hypothetical protein [Niabella ginsengisoli]|uniref:Uncharacterized protein n=1 Tax=Niabella ginsengisoli TaxID=522298 RepID=A0ABS9SMG4_9BACT|nr:hypothetical protein [Niabella ginsengisoli]MCH5599581.1 hypothetical protein [Niabella ginsengisoli]
MQIRKNVLFIAFYIISLKCSAQEPAINSVHLGVVTPVSTQGKYAKDISPSFALHALQGVNLNNRGMSIGGLYTKLYGNNKGVMISGLVNKVNGSDKGLAIAGLYNGAANGRSVQVAGLHNQKSGNGFIQIAGLSNCSQYEILQIAGLVNINKNVNTQIAGLVNVAKTVKGVQIAGLINIADTSDHPIGLLNIIKTGEQQIGIQIYDDASANIVLRTGGRKTYGIIGVGAGNELKRTVLQMEAGIGYHIPLSQQFRVNAEVVAMSKTDFTFSNTHNR